MNWFFSRSSQGKITEQTMMYYELPNKTESTEENPVGSLKLDKGPLRPPRNPNDTLYSFGLVDRLSTWPPSVVVENL
jgi:hypothetical protein